MNSCPNCRIGRLLEVSLTYYRSFNGKTLIAPYAPANKCNHCRYVTYDRDFLYTINQMIAPKTKSDFQPMLFPNQLGFQQFFAHGDASKMI